MKHPVKDGQDQESRHGGTYYAANHDGSQWALDFSTSTGSQGHWNEPKRCDQSSHF
jgi:hypothetical protein